MLKDEQRVPFALKEARRLVEEYERLQQLGEVERNLSDAINDIGILSLILEGNKSLINMSDWKNREG